MVGGLAALVLTGLLFSQLSFTFFPPQNRDFSQVRIFLAAGLDPRPGRGSGDRGAARSSKTAPEVLQVVERVNVGSATLNLTLDRRAQAHLDRDRAQPGAQVCPQIADARVNFQSQSGGGPEGGGGGGRDITLHLGGDDPELAVHDGQQDRGGDGGAAHDFARRASQGDLVRPEIIIRPRQDLAADLGVTTAALGQTIRLATLGDIDQNSAKFSLSDRQVPIRVALARRGSRRDLATLENLPVPTQTGGSVPLKAVAEISFGAGPTTVQRTNQVRRIAVGADLAPGVVVGRRVGRRSASCRR